MANCSVNSLLTVPNLECPDPSKDANLAGDLSELFSGKFPLTTVWSPKFGAKPLVSSQLKMNLNHLELFFILLGNQLNSVSV